MDARAKAAAHTRQQILEAAYELMLRLPYDEMTLQAVAEKAGVAVQTVLRHFGTKEGLILAGRELWVSQEHERREVEPGDVAAAANVLADRYEELTDLMLHVRPLEERVPAIAQMLATARNDHMRWLAEIFEDSLPKERGAKRRRRLAQLFGVTEIVVWITWRRSLGLSRNQAERALADSLNALLASWKPQ